MIENLLTFLLVAIIFIHSVELEGEDTKYNEQVKKD